MSWFANAALTVLVMAALIGFARLCAENADIAPDIRATYITYLKVGAPFNAASYLSGFTYQREEIRLGGMVPSGFDLETKGVVQTQNPGTYTVSYTLTYTEKDQRNPEITHDHTAYSKLIVIVEG